jgi:hypothetical protein
MARFFSWWFAPIRSVSTESHVPGLVTLQWSTPEPTPTRVSGPDGSLLYDAATPSRDHRVTLAGGPGSAVDVRIQAGPASETVHVRF